jgi:TrpR-related protein YerC/YecD
MQLSKKKITPELKTEIVHNLHQVIADFKKEPEIEMFLNDILTESEVMALAKRLAISQELLHGGSYNQIRSQLKVSSATIASIQDRLETGTGGLRLAVDKLNIDHWAGLWAKRVTKFLGLK